MHHVIVPLVSDEVELGAAGVHVNQRVTEPKVERGNGEIPVPTDTEYRNFQ